MDSCYLFVRFNLDLSTVGPQILFSLLVTFGIMMAYMSHCERTEPAYVNSCIVAVSNCLFLQRRLERVGQWYGGDDGKLLLFCLFNLNS